MGFDQVLTALNEPIYHLVNIQKAIENGHSWLLYLVKTWRFSRVMPVSLPGARFHVSMLLGVSFIAVSLQRAFFGLTGHILKVWHPKRSVILSGESAGSGEF